MFSYRTFFRRASFTLALCLRRQIEKTYRVGALPKRDLVRDLRIPRRSFRANWPFLEYSWTGRPSPRSRVTEEEFSTSNSRQLQKCCTLRSIGFWVDVREGRLFQAADCNPPSQVGRSEQTCQYVPARAESNAFDGLERPSRWRRIRNLGSRLFWQQVSILREGSRLFGSSH